MWTFNNGNIKYYIYSFSRYYFKSASWLTNCSEKPNNDPEYIDINSKHPPQTLKKLPKSISKRLLEYSSSKNIFDKYKTLYEKFLNNSGFLEKLLNHQDHGNKNQNKKIEKRRRKITLFNLPFSKPVKMNIG